MARRSRHTTLEAMHKKSKLIDKQVNYNLNFGDSKTPKTTDKHQLVMQICDELRDAANNLKKHELNYASRKFVSSFGNVDTKTAAFLKNIAGNFKTYSSGQKNRILSLVKSFNEDNNSSSDVANNDTSASDEESSNSSDNVSSDTSNDASNDASDENTSSESGNSNDDNSQLNGRHSNGPFEPY